MAKVTIQFAGDTSSLKKSVADVKSQIDGLNRSSSSGGLNLSNVLGIGTAITGIMALKNAMSGLGGLIKDSSKQAMDFETLGIQLEVLTGNVATAKKLLADVTKYGAETPLEQGPLQQSVKSLLQFNVAATDVMDILKMLGDISMGEGDKLQRLAVIFGKVSSANKMNAEDLNQLIDAGYNPAIAMSQQMGVSVSELRDKMAAGEIGISDLISAMKKATGEGGTFHNMLKRIANETLQGKLSNLSDTFKQLEIVFGTGMNSGLKNIVDQANNLLPKYTESTRRLGETVGRLLTALSQHIPKMADDMEKALKDGGIFGALKYGIISVLSDPQIQKSVEVLGKSLIPKEIREGPIGNISKTFSIGGSEVANKATSLATVLLLTRLLSNTIASKAAGGLGLGLIGSTAIAKETPNTTLSQKISDWGITITGSIIMLGNLSKLISTRLLGIYALVGAAGFKIGNDLSKSLFAEYFKVQERNDHSGAMDMSGYDMQAYTDGISKLAAKIKEDKKEKDRKFELQMGELATIEEMKVAGEKFDRTHTDVFKHPLMWDWVDPLDYVRNEDPLMAFFAHPPQGNKSRPLDAFKPFLNSLQSMGGGKLFGGIDPGAIARESLNQLKIIAKNTGKQIVAVAG